MWELNWYFVAFSPGSEMPAVRFFVVPKYSLFGFWHGRRDKECSFGPMFDPRKKWDWRLGVVLLWCWRDGWVMMLNIVHHDVVHLSC